MTPFAYGAVLVASLLVSVVLVSLSRRVAVRIDALDHPDGGRKTQESPIPRLGGVAVALSLTIVWTGASLIFVGADALTLVLGIMLPGVAMALLGLMDDRHNLNPWFRLASQAVIAAGALLGGSRIGLTSNEIVNAAIFILWVMIIGQFLVAALAFALVGVAAGFLWHNWYPAKVYLGDSGAYFLGFMLAIVVVRLRPTELPPIQAAAIAVLLVALPLVDLFYVVTRRLAKGIHPFTAGRDHLSHTLQRRGLSVPHAVLVLECFLVLTSGLAIALAVVAFP